MIKLLSIEPFSTSAKNLLIFLFFNWIKMKETQDLRERKPSRNHALQGLQTLVIVLLQVGEPQTPL